MLNEFASPSAHDGQDAGPDLRETFVRALARSWVWVCLAVVLGAAAGFAVGLIRPNTYVSTTKLLLRNGAREQITSESLIDLEGERLTSPPTMFDELQMLSDVAIFERVAQKLGPNEVLEPADPRRTDGPRTPAPVRWMHSLQAGCIRWMARQSQLGVDDDGDLLELATKTLVRNTAITNEPGSSVVVVSHTSTSPEKARAVAQALAEAFIERHREHFSIQSVVRASQAKLERAKQGRDAAANAYVEFMNRNGQFELDPQMPALQAEVTAIEGELFAARVRKQAINKQRGVLTGRLDDVPAEITAPGPVIMIPNEDYETQLILKRNLLTQKQSLPLENRPLEELRRLERHFDKQIAEVDTKLAQLPKVVAQDPLLRENVAHTALSTRVEDLDLEDQALDVQIELLEQRLAEKQTRAAALRKEILLATLNRKDLESTREAEDAYYKQLLARYSVLETLGNIDLHEDPNLRVLQAATLDRDKVGPKRVSLLLKGLLAGLLVGIAIAALRLRFDRRLPRPEVFERNGLRVLGVVPELSSLHRLRAEG